MPLPEVLGPSPMQVHMNPAVPALSTITANEEMIPMQLLSTVLPSTNTLPSQLPVVETTKLLRTAMLHFPTTKLDTSIPELRMTLISLHPHLTTSLSPAEGEVAVSTTSNSATTELHTSMPELLALLHPFPTTSLSLEREVAVSPTCNSAEAYLEGPVNNDGEILHKYTKFCVITITFLDHYSISGNRIVSLSLLGTYL